MPIKDLSAEEQRSLRETVCNGASDPHIDYYLRCCKARGVDPFSGQMYLQVRTSHGKLRPAVAMTIDGARMQASRSEGYAGADDIEYDNEDAERPLWARATVWRFVKKERYPFTAKVRWREFCPPPPADTMWKVKPYHMLGKVAEMQALRRAFPEAVYDMSTDEDHDTVIDEAPVAVETKPGELPKAGVKPVKQEAPDRPTPTQWSNALKAFVVLGKTQEDIWKKIGVEAYARVTMEHMDILHGWYDELEREQVPPPEGP